MTIYRIATLTKICADLLAHPVKGSSTGGLPTVGVESLLQTQIIFLLHCQAYDIHFTLPEESCRKMCIQD